MVFLDVMNRNHVIGAYWQAYRSYPDEEFYYFMHDSMLVNANLDYLKSRALVTLCYFDRNQANFNKYSTLASEKLGIPYEDDGSG